MIKIEKLNKKTPVFDITVEDNHNFYANDILVHNCAEILEVVSEDEVAVCNLASIGLPKFVTGKKNKKYDFDKLYEVSYQATINLNKVIDVTYYPIPEAKKSNLRHRPIGLGVQGLADVFFLMDMAYGSPESKQLNKEIFETIYFAALKASCDLAKRDGVYETYEGSPLSQGIFQFDMWNVTPTNRHDWNGLREDIKKYGVRNSLLCAQMPTASCFLSETKIKTSEGIKSYQQIMDEQNIDWKSIEQTNEQQWIKFENPIQVETRFGLHESNKIFYNGHRELITITFEDGSEYSMTENHKLLVELENGTTEWKCAKDLKENDNILSIETNEPVCL